MSVWSRLARTLHPGRHDEDVEQELQYHLAMKEHDGCDAQAARVKFGNRSQDQRGNASARHSSPGSSPSSATSDTVSANCRRCHSSRWWSWFAPLGIGANSAIFSLVDAALLKSLPVESSGAAHYPVEQSRLAGSACAIHSRATRRGSNGPMQGSSIAPRIYRELARQQQGFASVIGYSDGDVRECRRKRTG